MLFYMLPFHSFKQWGVSYITDMEVETVYAKDIIYSISFKKYGIPIFIPTTNIPTAFRKFMIDVYVKNEKFKARTDTTSTILWFAIGA